MRHAIGFEEFVDDPRSKRVTRTSFRRGDEEEEEAVKASLKDCARRGGKKGGT